MASYPNFSSSVLEDEAEEDENIESAITEEIKMEPPNADEFEETPPVSNADKSANEVKDESFPGVDNSGISIDTMPKKKIVVKVRALLPKASSTRNVALEDLFDAEDGLTEDYGGDEFGGMNPPSPDGIKNDDPSVARCDTCDISFQTKRQRSEHLRDVHGVEKPFKCEHCGARFPYSSSLYNHTRIHSDNKPFKCSLCNAAFRWKNSLRHHRLFIHKEEPTNVKIAAKCVLEGKKPAPPTENSQSTKRSRSRASRSSSLPDSKRLKIGATSSASASVKSTTPIKINLTPIFVKSQAKALRCLAPATDSDDSGAPSTSTGAEAIKKDGQKRKRKQRSTSRVAAWSKTPEECSVARKGHTCGHCEKQFVVWADLVSHIQECAEQERNTLDDNGTATSGHFVASDDGAIANESDSDSDAPGGLVIDQHDTDDDNNYEPEYRSNDFVRSSYDSDSLGSQNDSNDAAQLDEDGQRTSSLGNRFGCETTRNQEGRNTNLESTVSRLKMQLKKKR